MIAVSGSSSRANCWRNQWLTVPLVASPDIEACWPGNSQGAYHRRLSATRWGVISMMKMVEPYISIMSPGFEHPDAERCGCRIDGADDHRRAGGEPGLVGSACVTVPAMSVVQAGSGSLSSATMSLASSSL